MKAFSFVDCTVKTFKPWRKKHLCKVVNVGSNLTETVKKEGYFIFKALLFSHKCYEEGDRMHGKESVIDSRGAWGLNLNLNHDRRSITIIFKQLTVCYFFSNALTF